MIDKEKLKSLPYGDFRKVIVNNGLELSEGSIRTVFDGFDVEKTQSVDYEEFLRIIKVGCYT